MSGSNSSKQFRHRFAELTERHSQVVKIAENGASELNRVAATILSTVELEEEGSRLEEVFRSLAPVHGKARDRVGEAAYCEQLVAAYSDLNSAKSSRGSPEDILREFEAQPLSSSATDSPIRDPLEFNLGELIQSAWEMDQFALLGAKERFLDEVRLHSLPKPHCSFAADRSTVEGPVGPSRTSAQGSVRQLSDEL